MNFSRCAAALLLCFAGGLPARAEPLTELKAVSALEGLDAKKLQAGEVLTARGTQGKFTRGLYLESCYYLKAPLVTTGELLLRWNPARYKESEVSRYQTYLWPTPADFFKPYQPVAGRAADRFLIDSTAWANTHGTAGGLHLSPAELPLLRAGGGWPRILEQRSEAMATGGLGAVPDYQADDVTLNALQEYRRLLKMTPAITARFAPLTEDKSLLAGGPAVATEAFPYAEESLVRDHTSWCLGVMAAHKTPEAWQIVDCTYYSVDTYFMSVSLYQLWPMGNGTLVWQVAYISAPFRAYLAHVDKVFAGREMAKDSLKNVGLLRRELESRNR